MHIFLVCARKSQDIAQSQKNFAQSHDRMTALFRNSGCNIRYYMLGKLSNQKSLISGAGRATTGVAVEGKA